MHRNIKLLAIHNFLCDFILFAPIAIIYFKQVSGSYALGMSIFAITQISSALFEVPTGIYSDMIGRKKTIVLGSLAFFAGFLFYAIGGSYWMLVLGAILEGLARSFFSGNNNALLYDTLCEKKKLDEYSHYLGKTDSLFQLALSISALLGTLIGNWPIVWLVWISVIPKFLGLIVSFFFIEPRVHTQKSGNMYAHLNAAIKQFKTNKKLRYLTIVSAIKFSLGESGYLYRSAFFQMVWPVWAIGFAYALNNMFAFISFYMSGFIIKKLGAAKALLLEMMYVRTINIISLLFPTVFSPLCMASTSFMYGFSSVALSSLTQKEFTQEQRATLGSFGSLLSCISFGIVSVLVGIIGDIFGVIPALLGTNILSFSTLWFYNKIFRNKVSL